MKIRIQVVIEHDDETSETIVEEIGCLQRGDPRPETLGLTLEEGKALLGNIQRQMVKQQIAAYVDEHKACRDCGRPHRRNGRHHITYRTLFGKMRLESPRFYICPCRPREKKSFSPVVQLLPERTAPELRYLQTKWASLMSYGLTVDLLEEVLPLKTNYASVYRHTHQTAKRIESELGEEQFMFAHGNEYDRHALPHPDEPLTVGIDGGFVHARDGDNREAVWFEVIVGKSMQDSHEPRRFGFVTGHDQKPKRRLYETLRAQGLQMNQAITFLSAGGDTVRNLQYYISPVAEHILDWFHVTMKLTVRHNIAKGLPGHEELKRVPNGLERIKWFLWHGNAYQALEALRFLKMDLEMFENEDEVAAKLYKHVQEFATYIHSNCNCIPNYGDRYRYGEMISTAFVESTVNELISRRMVKKQQMRWTKEGAHLLLQTRVKTLDGDLRDKLVEWYPGMGASSATTQLPVAAGSTLSC
jgi:hypothetical protein